MCTHVSASSTANKVNFISHSDHARKRISSLIKLCEHSSQTILASPLHKTLTLALK